MRASKELREIFDVYSAKEKVRFYKTTNIPAIGEAWDLGMRLTFALNLGTASSIEAMQNQYSDEQITAVLATLSAKDGDVLNALWKHINKYWTDEVDADGNVIAGSFATAEGDWMTTEFVSFKSEMIDLPSAYIGPATLVLKKDNPSGLPENDASLSIPIVVEY